MYVAKAGILNDLEIETSHCAKHVKLSRSIPLVFTTTYVIHVGYLTFDEVNFQSQLYMRLLRAPDNDEMKQNSL